MGWAGWGCGLEGIGVTILFAMAQATLLGCKAVRPHRLTALLQYCKGLSVISQPILSRCAPISLAKP